MFIRRIFNKQQKRRRSCAQCQRIRLFLLAAASLTLAMFFADRETAPLSGLTPMNVALAMMLLGSVGFLLRVIDHILSERRQRIEEKDIPNNGQIDPLHPPRQDI